MDFVTMLGVLLGVSVAVERAAEIIKPLYLKIINNYLKTPRTECTKIEKEIMSILLGPVICIVAQVGIDLPGISEANIIQQILAGLVASLGSNVLHALMSIILAIKNSAETVNTTDTTNI
jgi:hypothetical protein